MRQGRVVKCNSWKKPLVKKNGKRFEKKSNERKSKRDQHERANGCRKGMIKVKKTSIKKGGTINSKIASKPV